MDFKNFSLKKVNKKYFIAVLAVGAALMLVSNLTVNTSQKNDTNVSTEKNAALKNDDTEKRLAEIIGKITGVSDVSVFITYENNGVHKTVENVTEKNSKSESGTEASREKNTVMKKQSGTEEPFVHEETLPQVRGVMIVAKGVGGSAINAEITDAVSAVLGVSVHKVKILQSD